MNIVEHFVYITNTQWTKLYIYIYNQWKQPAPHLVAGIIFFVHVTCFSHAFMNTITEASPLWVIWSHHPLLFIVMPLLIKEVSLTLTALTSCTEACQTIPADKLAINGCHL
jgi:hypothetical protein